MATSTEHERLEQVLRGQHALMDEVHQWLEEEQKQDDILRAVVLSARREKITEILGLPEDRIFTTGTIRSLCVKYRLRFLDAGLFKGEIPPQALHGIRQLERKAGAPLTSFKIMAPAARFRLCDSEVDPLLFVPVGADRYYLVHKWGNDLSPWRMVLGWPTRHPLTLAATVVAFAVLIGTLMPAHLLELWGVHRVLFTLWCTMVCISFTLFGWFAFFGQFSVHAWNSRYFNG
jgi:hypothetical protein